MPNSPTAKILAILVAAVIAILLLKLRSLGTENQTLEKQLGTAREKRAILCNVLQAQLEIGSKLALRPEFAPIQRAGTGFALAWIEYCVAPEDLQRAVDLMRGLDGNDPNVAPVLQSLGKLVPEDWNYGTPAAGSGSGR